MLKFIFSKLNSNTFPQTPKPEKRLDFSLKAQLFGNVYSLILENAQSVLYLHSVLELSDNTQL